MTFWSQRAVLVTGGCGFIGSHLVERLLAEGANVRVLGKYNSRSDLGWLTHRTDDNLAVTLGDVADPYLVARLVEGVDTVFHLAALIGIPFSYVAPEQYVKTNISGTVAVLEAARRHGVRRVINTSTSETYGTAQYTPIDEAHPLVGQSPYSATKIAADKLVESYYLSFDLPVVTLRPFNTYGPRQSMRAVIPTLMTQALFSDRIRVGSLDPVRDMNHVYDTVSGFLGAGEASGVEGGVFNVGSGQGRTIGEILESIQAVTNVSRPVEIEDQRVRPEGSEVGKLICDYSKAASAFGYQPRVDFAEGLESVRDHITAHPPARDPAEYRV
jgi:NAD dependent epimerase/dehydratase